MRSVIFQERPVLDEAKINLLIDDWLKARDAAASLLVEHLGIDSPREILDPRHRGRELIANTGWAYRTHGIGVDVTPTNGRGGIDFDFSADDTNIYKIPDWWRLQLFARRAIHDQQVDARKYADIIDDLSTHKEFVQSVISRRFDNS
jgi:hypothetical protein